jgi:hypothetical protein
MSAVIQDVSTAGPVELGNQRLGCNAAVCIANDFVNLGPVRIEVDPDSEPPAVANVWRSKELLAVLGDHLFLRAWWCRAPEPEMVKPMVVVIDGYELLLAADEESG